MLNAFSSSSQSTNQSVWVVPSAQGSRNTSSTTVRRPTTLRTAKPQAGRLGRGVLRERTKQARGRETKRRSVDDIGRKMAQRGILPMAKIWRVAAQLSSIFMPTGCISSIDQSFMPTGGRRSMEQYFHACRRYYLNGAYSSYLPEPVV